MDIIIGIVVGTIYGRNMHEINKRGYEDICQFARIVYRTNFATMIVYMLETVCLAIETKILHKEYYYTHDILCSCNRRSCRPLNINTYVRKIKALN